MNAHLAPLGRLEEVLAGMESVLVAFSGGVDSALVVAIAHKVLGARAVALTATSPTLPAEEAAIAASIAHQVGIRHVIVDAHELESEGYARNDGTRCYFCKTELFDLAVDRARTLGLAVVCDGTITDDLGDHRPGLRAAAEHRVRHPLVEAGFDKASVRHWAQHLGLSVWDKPSFACLGSRFPVGTRVTADRVGRIGRIESVLRTFGFRQFRARFQPGEGGETVRIELGAAEIAEAVRPGVRDAIVDVCKAEGFRWVTLDLEGYRSAPPSGSAIAR